MSYAFESTRWPSSPPRRELLREMRGCTLSHGCRLVNWNLREKGYKAAKRSALPQGSYTNYCTHLVYRTHSLLAKQMITNRTSLEGAAPPSPPHFRPGQAPGYRRHARRARRYASAFTADNLASNAANRASSSR